MNCRDCKNAIQRNAAMARLGFRNCFHLPDYHLVSGGNRCRIGKFIPVAPAASRARVLPEADQ